MRKVAFYFFVALLLMSHVLTAQIEDDFDDLTDEEMEAIAQRDMLEFMITYAPIRFDKNLPVGEKLVYRSKIDESNISTIEVVKDTTNAFWIKEEFEGKIVFQLISRDTGELLEIKGYDDEGNFNHPQMLSDQEKEIVISNRNEKITKLSENKIYSKTSERKTYRKSNLSKNCKVISNNYSKESQILVSEEIPRLLPFAFSLELVLSTDVLSEYSDGLVESDELELIEHQKGVRQ